MHSNLPKVVTPSKSSSISSTTSPNKRAKIATTSKSHLLTRTTPDRNKPRHVTPSSIHDSARDLPKGNNINTGSYTSRRRICFCDRYECPEECEECNHTYNIPCDAHQSIPHLCLW